MQQDIFTKLFQSGLFVADKHEDHEIIKGRRRYQKYIKAFENMYEYNYQSHFKDSKIYPVAEAGQVYELDELRTYVVEKTNLKWIAYAIRRDTREVIDFNIGYRTNEMLRKVVHTILSSNPKKVYTDRFLNYRYLLPAGIHSTKLYGINHIERNNLTMRIHLKRLGRRTISYSKSLAVLAACVKIYFWE